MAEMGLTGHVVALKTTSSMAEPIEIRPDGQKIM
jgi:hypothetical protein